MIIILIWPGCGKPVDKSGKPVDNLWISAPCGADLGSLRSPTQTKKKDMIYLLHALTLAQGTQKQKISGGHWCKKKKEIFQMSMIIIRI